MADVFQTATAWLADRMTSTAGRRVLYRRGQDEAEAVAVPGRLVLELEATAGVLEKVEIRTFRFQVDNLPFGMPERHDRIVEDIGGIEVAWEFAPPVGVALVEFDLYRTTARVHAVAVG